jgi:hypothetical protein
MEIMIEERLATLFNSAKGGDPLPREVFRRLKFLARVMQEAPEVEGAVSRLLWFDESGAAQATGVGAGEVIIGRDSSCQVVLSSPKVSRRHCVIRRVDAALEIEELGSSNGTLVNGVRLPERGRRFLRDGDVIEVAGIAMGVDGA